MNKVELVLASAGLIIGIAIIIYSLMTEVNKLSCAVKILCGLFVILCASCIFQINFNVHTALKNNDFSSYNVTINGQSNVEKLIKVKNKFYNENKELAYLEYDEVGKPYDVLLIYKDGQEAGISSEYSIVLVN